MQGTHLLRFQYVDVVRVSAPYPSKSFDSFRTSFEFEMGSVLVLDTSLVRIVAHPYPQQWQPNHSPFQDINAAEPMLSMDSIPARSMIVRTPDTFI